MVNKKNILFFIGTVGGGGAERVLIDLLKYLNKDKYNISLVINRPGGELQNEVPDDINLIDRSGLSRSYFRLKDKVLGLSGIIRQQKADIVVSFLTGANRSLMRSRFFVDKRVKFVLREGNHPDYIGKMMDSFFWKQVAKTEVKWLYPRADKIIAISHGVKHEFVKNWKMNEHQFSVVHNPLDINRIKKMASEPVNSPWVSDKTSSRLIAVGRLVEQKGYMQLLDSFIKIRKKVNAKLMILGEGPLRKKVEARIRDAGLSGDIFLPGFVKNPWAYMHHADLYLSASLWEGFHLTIAEAMACGIPPVATDCDYGPSEIIADGENGRLVPVEDTEAFSKAVVELLKNEQLRKKMAGNAVLRAEDFEARKKIREYQDVFDGVLNLPTSLR